MEKRLTKEAELAWEKLSLANNFIFQKVMQNEELCKKVLSEILGIEIYRVEYPQYEKIIDIRFDAKSVRLDVYVVDDEETVYNIEIQNLNTDNIPKRGRYYQGMIDLDLIQKGCYYKELNKSVIIFICPFDYYNLGEYIYEFSNICRKHPKLEYGDETTKIIVNTHGKVGNVSEDLKAFLKCINGEFTVSPFYDTLKAEVDKIKRSEIFRREYMTLYIREEEIRHEALALGKAEGLAEGKAQGIAEGKAQGIAEGKAQGIAEAKAQAAEMLLNMLIKYHLEGKISLEEAIADSGLSKEEFLLHIKK